MLFTISFYVEISALLITIGLGLYLVTRSAHRPVAWLAAFTTWSMGGLFLNMLLSMAPPPVPNWLGALLIFWPKGIMRQDPAAWLQGWSSTLAPMFWLHGTLLMRSGPLKSWQRFALAGGYALCVIVIVVQALMPAKYNTISGDPLFLNALQAGPIYGFSLGTLVLVCGLSIYNLILAARAEPRTLPRQQLFVLSAATILAGLTGPVGLVAAFLKIPVPMFLIALLIGAGVLVTGFGVARYSALMDRRIFVRDFFLTAYTISAAVGFYLGITWLVNLIYPFPIFVYVLVGIVTVITHSFVDAARQNIDWTFFHYEKNLLRERMRSLEGQDNADLNESLSRLLEIVCEPLQASYAVLLVQKNEHYEQAAAYRWGEAGLTLPAYRLIADDLKLLQPSDLPQPFSKAALLIPIYLGDQQVGVLVLGAAEHGLRYSHVELDGLREFSDYLGGWLSPVILLRSEPPELLRQYFQPDADLSSSSPEIISNRTVELGLRSLHDYARLAELPLATAGLVRQSGGENSAHIDNGKAVQRVLCQAVEWLRPPGLEEENRINGIPRRDWYPYIILRDAYVNCLPNREIMERLYISEGTFNRTRRSAIRSLTRQLVEKERGALQ